MQRKIVLFIVEGKNDKIELNAILHDIRFKEYIEKYDCEFYCFNGDITADNNSNQNNIVKRLTDLVIKWRKTSMPFGTIKNSEMHEIIHIIDMDGAYIDSEFIKKSDVGSLEYFDNYIETVNPELTISRNNKKSYIIDDLVMIDRIDNIPYSIYYVSCNMDHLLFNRRNSNSKTLDAQKFAHDCYKGQIDLAETVFNDDYHLANEYYQSWEEIRNGFHSLGRYTNIDLIINNISDINK